MNRIAIIPARGGSKRIPQKNIKNFCGRPMISYPIEALKKSNLFDKIHVSTDDKKIKNVVTSLGLKIDFLRPKDLSNDFTPIMPVIKFVVEQYLKMNQTFEEIWIILPCSPFLSSSDLIEASIIFNQNKFSNPLMAIAEYPVPIEWAFDINENGLLSPVKKGNFAIRSQDLKKKYHDAGMFYAYSKDIILNVDYNGSDQNFLPYLISKDKAIDIDDPEDWEYAEKLFKIRLI